MHWLLKSEPDVFSISDLKENHTELWDGVRNYQARNFLRSMQLGDLAFFYHSNTKIPGIYGVMKIHQAGVLDPTQFDPKSKYFDPKSQQENPRWDTVVVEFVEEWDSPVSLEQLKAEFEGEDFALVRKGNRLSVMPVDETYWQRIFALKK